MQKACTTLGPYFKGTTDKAEVQKDQTSVHKCKAKCKALRETRVQTKRLTMNSRERQQTKRCQMCGKHEKEQEGSARHVDGSILADMYDSRRAR